MADRPSSRSPDRIWFAPKRYGYGSGLPVRWQGWAVLAIYLIAVAGFVAMSGWVRPVGLVATALILCAVCSRTTEGGWRWRWRGRD